MVNTIESLPKYMDDYEMDKESLKQEIDDLQTNSQNKRTLLSRKKDELYQLMLKREQMYEEEEGVEIVNKEQLMTEKAVMNYNERKKREKKTKAEDSILNAAGVV